MAENEKFENKKENVTEPKAAGTGRKLHNFEKDNRTVGKLLLLAGGVIAAVMIVGVLCWDFKPACDPAEETQVTAEPESEPGQAVTGPAIAPSEKKPVVYVYAAEDGQEVTVTLDAYVTLAYPEREGRSWTVKADRDGTLYDADGQQYNYLYWEDAKAEPDTGFAEGFCVAGKDTAPFLEKALAEMGLNRREANEFIVYWLPVMEKNAYNIVSFESAAYEDAYPLHTEPEADNMLRVNMRFKASDTPVDLKPQDLSALKGDFKREGLHIVEWGGCEIE